MPATAGHKPQIGDFNGCAVVGDLDIGNLEAGVCAAVVHSGKRTKQMDEERFIVILAAAAVGAPTATAPRNDRPGADVGQCADSNGIMALPSVRTMLDLVSRLARYRRHESFRAPLRLSQTDPERRFDLLPSVLRPTRARDTPASHGGRVHAGRATCPSKFVNRVLAGLSSPNRPHAPHPHAGEVL